MGQPTSLLYLDEPLYTDYAQDNLFADLHIDQILAEVTRDLDEYRLMELYRHKPIRLADVRFRQEIVRDLQNEKIRGAAERFVKAISQARRYLKTRDELPGGDVADKWHLDAAVVYCAGLEAFLAEISACDIRSEGLARLIRGLEEIARSEAFQSLAREANAAASAFSRARYALSVDIGNNVVIVEDDSDPADFLEAMRAAFDRFDLSGVSSELSAFADIRMNSLEVGLHGLLRRKYPALFERLASFREIFPDIIDVCVLSFERHAVFYLSYLSHIRRMEEKGFAFALAEFSQDANLSIDDGYDMSLAMLGRGDIVANSLTLSDDERSLLLTGPNQGGKTTFARMLGQTLFLSCAGLPAPCGGAALPFISGIRTHFAREETAGSQSGRLQEELLRLRGILAGVKPGSVMIFNELFASTTTLDACELGVRILKKLEAKGCLTLFVTHIAELADAAGDAVSLVAEVAGDPPQSTYRILRRPADGAAHASRLLAKYRLRLTDIEGRKHAAIASLR